MIFLNEVKKRLGISPEDTSKDDLITSYIDQYRQEILNYCNLSTFPEALNYTLIDMVCDVYNRPKKGKYNGEIINEQQGNRSTQYESHANAGDLINDYRSKLRQFRRVKAR